MVVEDEGVVVVTRVVGVWGGVWPMVVCGFSNMRDVQETHWALSEGFQRASISQSQHQRQRQRPARALAQPATRE